MRCAVRSGATSDTSATWRLRVKFQGQVLVAHVARLTTLYHHRLISSSRRGATEGMLDGDQCFELDTAAREWNHHTSCLVR